MNKTASISGIIILWIFSSSFCNSPAITLVEPTTFAIITKNTVRLRANISDSSIREIRYYINYKPSIDSFRQETYGTINKQLGSSVMPITDFVADLTSIPEQDERTINFVAAGYDTNGKLVAVSNDRQFIVLDRKTAISGKIFNSKYCRNTPHNTYEEDWEKSDTLTFTNGENPVLLLSLWNKKAIYFRIIVNDNTITGNYTERGYLSQNLDPVYHSISDNYVALPENDEVEFFFDCALDRASRRNMNHVHMLVGAKGAWYGRRYDRQLGISEMWGKNNIVKVYIPEDSSRYEVFIAIPWKDLSIEPRTGQRCGFDIYNKDYIRAGSPSTGISWAGNEWTNYNNPSEWGTLILSDDNTSFITTIVILLTFVISTLFFLKKRTGAASTKGTALSRSAKLVQRIDDLITANYADPELNAQKAASIIGINPKYLGATYKSIKNKTFLQQLTQKRIDKSIELLKENKFSITEISFRVGFSSSSHFAKVFKEITKSSPSDFKTT